MYFVTKDVLCKLGTIAEVCQLAYLKNEFNKMLQLIKSYNDAVIMCHLSKFPITFASTEIHDSCFIVHTWVLQGQEGCPIVIVKRNNFTTAVAVI